MRRRSSTPPPRAPTPLLLLKMTQGEFLDFTFFIFFHFTACKKFSECAKLVENLWKIMKIVKNMLSS
jgi:hypothetical protein